MFDEEIDKILKDECYIRPAIQKLIDSKELKVKKIWNPEKGIEISHNKEWITIYYSEMKDSIKLYIKCESLNLSTYEESKLKNKIKNIIMISTLEKTKKGYEELEKMNIE